MSFIIIDSKTHRLVQEANTLVACHALKSSMINFTLVNVPNQSSVQMRYLKEQTARDSTELERKLSSESHSVKYLYEVVANSQSLLRVVAKESL